VAIAWPQNRTMPEGVWNVAQMIRELAGELVDNGAWPGTTLLASDQALSADT
jgi:hypothetical protein